jgi:amino acid permease
MPDETTNATMTTTTVVMKTPAAAEHGATTSAATATATTATSISNGEEHHEIVIVRHDDETMDENGDENGVRVGSISSARFNILSTMVGGGCLSLPLAFSQSGNGLVGPLCLILVGLLSDFCFRLLVAASVQLHPPHTITPGKNSFESITSAAFGPSAYIMSMGLVTAMCFFGAVGYSVLLRDMLEPMNDWMMPPPSLGSSDSSNDWGRKNCSLFLVIFVVTPACTLQTFTALKNCGAASMMSILILGTCIVIRSVQCNATAPDPWYTYITLWPESPRELLDAVPLYISCFVCHYNILPVHNELRDPTPTRVSWWLRSTTWYAVGLYMIMGLAGSSYGHCTPSGRVQGNVLLDFEEDDPLLMVGRMCLALTITLAFPMLVIPARDILLRSVLLPWIKRRTMPTSTTGTTRATTTATTASATSIGETEQLQEPLLTDEEQREADTDNGNGNDNVDDPTTTVPAASFFLRLLTSIGIFWTAGAVASCVDSIDIVWDLLGSSLSILLSYLIPCGSYLVIMRNVENTFWSKVLCWILIAVMLPLMFLSTANAIDNTFIH